MPAVSVVIPVYNSEKYVEKCIQSGYGTDFARPGDHYNQ